MPETSPRTAPDTSHTPAPGGASDGGDLAGALADAARKAGLRGLLFDLDGTLVDSLPDIARSVNLLLGEDGLAPLTREEVRAMIGHGIGRLVERAFAARGGVPSGTSSPEAALAVRVARMMAIYGDNLTVETAPLPDADRLLAACAEAGLKVAVVTNKPEALSRRIVAHFGWQGLAPVVIGGDTCATRKPQPDMLLEAAARLDLRASACLMVGDSAADIDAARAARMRSVALEGGYGEAGAATLGADATVPGLARLPAAIAGLPA